MAHAVFLRAANVGGNNVFKPKEFAAAHPELALKNIGAAGTFASHASLGPSELQVALEEALPVAVDMVVLPQSQIQELVSTSYEAREGAKVEVTVALAPRQPGGLPDSWPDVNAPILILEDLGWCFVTDRIPGGKFDAHPSIRKQFGMQWTTRSWGIMQKIAAA